MECAEVVENAEGAEDAECAEGRPSRRDTGCASWLKGEETVMMYKLAIVGVALCFDNLLTAVAMGVLDMQHERNETIPIFPWSGTRSHS